MFKNFIIMLPIEIEKWRFARRLYPGLGKTQARKRLWAEISNSPALRKRLASVGYRPNCKMLRRAELLVLTDVLLLPDDFWT